MPACYGQILQRPSWRTTSKPRRTLTHLREAQIVASFGQHAVHMCIIHYCSCCYGRPASPPNDTACKTANTAKPAPPPVHLDRAGLKPEDRPMRVARHSPRREQKNPAIPDICDTLLTDLTGELLFWRAPTPEANTNVDVAPTHKHARQRA